MYGGLPTMHTVGGLFDSWVSLCIICKTLSDYYLEYLSTLHRQLPQPETKLSLSTKLYNMLGLNIESVCHMPYDCSQNLNFIFDKFIMVDLCFIVV